MTLYSNLFTFPVHISNTWPLNTCPTNQVDIQMKIEGPRTKVAYPNEKCGELSEMPKNVLKSYPPLRRNTWKSILIFRMFWECSEMNFALTPTLGGYNQWICGLGQSVSQPFHKGMEYFLCQTYVILYYWWRCLVCTRISHGYNRKEHSSQYIETETGTWHCM